jgi:hypothetical protein
MRHLALLLLVPACGTVLPAEPPGTDAPAATARCNRSQPFGTPTVTASLDTTASEASLALTGDELTAFSSTIDGVLRSAGRADSAASFLFADALIRGVNSEPGGVHGPSVTSDGLDLYFLRDTGGFQAFHTSRFDADSAFAAAATLTVDGAPLGSAIELRISSDGLTLYWVDFNDLTLRAARASAPDAFVGAHVVSALRLHNPTLSADELTLYYTPDATEVFVATRPSSADTFDAGAPLGALAVGGSEAPVFVTADDCVLYLTTDSPGGPGGLDIWEARR